MKYSTHLYTNKSTCVIIPVFTSDSGDKTEAESVKRMNEFYDEMKKAVFVYTESADFPKGSKYFARADILEADNKFQVSVIMKLRKSGKTLSTRTLSHTWENGVVVEKRTDR
ncbi:MAG: hypothetical protein IKL24_03255 [Clostridia bacterium]|nr:hypothetical protein [Clostridia bacterium]